MIRVCNSSMQALKFKREILNPCACSGYLIPIGWVECLFVDIFVLVLEQPNVSLTFIIKLLKSSQTKRKKEKEKNPTSKDLLRLTWRFYCKPVLPNPNFLESLANNNTTRQHPYQLTMVLSFGGIVESNPSHIQYLHSCFGIIGVI